MPLYFSMALISASAIAYEVLLTRLFSIVQWHHFAYMVISLALLGFGASGTLIVLARGFLMRRFIASYAALACAAGALMVVCFGIAQHVPFNPSELAWDSAQVLYLVSIYLLLFLPFLCAATCMGLAYYRFKERISRLYFFDLVGAGLGALGIVLAMYAFFPIRCLALLGAVPFVAAAIALLDGSFRVRRAWSVGLIALGMVSAFASAALVHDLKISEYKGLSKMLDVPGVEVVEERSSPLGYISVVNSPTVPLRHAPGMSLASEEEIPRQLAIYTDADSLSTITHFDGDVSKLKYLDDTSGALPYHLLHRPDVLILGAGGGDDVLLAIYGGARSIDAVELDPQIIDLVVNTYDDFGGRVFARQEVNVFASEARGFVARSEQDYDLIQLTLMDSFSASSAGLYALSESYLYTVEAFKKYLQRLRPEGFLSITRWLDIPPRGGLKLTSTAIAALDGMGVDDPSRRIALIRSWRTITLIVKNGDITAADISSIRKFCDERAFDVVYYPGMKRAEANRFNHLREPYFYDGVTALLGDGRDEFLSRYKFDVRPTTDRRPYFFNFFKWATFAEALRIKGAGGAALIDWGYPVLWAALVQAVAISALLILLPLRRLGRATATGRLKAGVFIYFAALGLAFLSIEIAFIQRLMLFLNNPTYAIAVALSSFLIFAGIGSALSQRFSGLFDRDPMRGRPKAVAFAAAWITAVAIIYVAVLPQLLDSLIGLSNAARIAVSIALVAPIKTFMGMPFPLGLAQTADKSLDLVPWAWGINGCASVISPVLATLVAIQFGFTPVVFTAVAMYILAAIVMGRFIRA